MTVASASAALAGTRFTDLRWLAEVDSTNELAASLGRSGHPGGLVVAADHQLGGRGRRGRVWEAPPNSSLLISVLLGPADVPGGLAHSHLATLALALAAQQACATHVPSTSAGAALKWPNDIVVEGRGKLGGILGQASAGRVIAGLGLNVDWRGPLPAGAVSLAQVAAPGADLPSREDLAVTVLRHLDGLLNLEQAQLVDAFAAVCTTVGRLVTVDTGRGLPLTGIARRLTTDGFLVVERDGGEEIVLDAADVVHLR